MRGELDWIVMKALEKDRNRRYETANGFAADVQRYLADEPVQACPPSAGTGSASSCGDIGRRSSPRAWCCSPFGRDGGYRVGVAGSPPADRSRPGKEVEARKQEGIAQANEARAEAEKKRAVEFRDKARWRCATTGTDVEQ